MEGCEERRADVICCVRDGGGRTLFNLGRASLHGPWLFGFEIALAPVAAPVGFGKVFLLRTEIGLGELLSSTAEPLSAKYVALCLVVGGWGHCCLGRG